MISLTSSLQWMMDEDLLRGSWLQLALGATFDLSAENYEYDSTNYEKQVARMPRLMPKRKERKKGRKGR